jgi:hypothetical protein
MKTVRPGWPRLYALFTLFVDREAKAILLTVIDAKAGWRPAESIGQ